MLLLFVSTDSIWPEDHFVSVPYKMFKRETMNRAVRYGILGILIGLSAAVYGQASKTPKLKAAKDPAPLKLVGSIALPGVTGDFDHLTLDAKRQRLLIAGEDHKTLEIIDLKAKKRLQSVTGMGTPHSLLYLPASDQLYLTDGDEGTIKILQGSDYKQIGKISLAAGADSVGYDAAAQTLFVVTGGKDVPLDYSVLSAVDLPGQKKTRDLRFESAHVEAMALEHEGPNLFINVTDKNQIVVVNRKTMTKVKEWTVGAALENSPVALDEANRRLLIVCRKPGMLVVMNADTGSVVASLRAAGRSDDIAFDKNAHRIYVPGGEGYISVFEQKDADHYEALAKVPTATGAKTALLVPELHRLFVAVSPGDTKALAKVLIFETAQ